MTEVILHVYNVPICGNDNAKNTSKQINELFKDGIGLGEIFHSAIQIYGDEEWSFGFCEQGTGVFSCPSRKNVMYTYRETIELGKTSLSIFRVNQILRELSGEWPGSSYDLLSKNCNHFCDELCERLGVPKLPGWVYRFANSGDVAVEMAGNRAYRTCSCNCSRRVESELGLGCNRSQLADQSCKTCGGIFIIDGIEPVSAETLSTVDLESMNTINPKLNWRTITKGRRSRKSTARSLNGVGKASNTSPESFGYYLVSDSDKAGEIFLGEPVSSKKEGLPLKKRRQFLRSPSAQPCTLSLHPQDISPQIHPSYPQSEDHDQFANPSCSSGRKSLSLNSNWQFREIDPSKSVKSGKNLDNGALPHRAAGGYYYGGDFSGIELLAAAASMDIDAANADKEDHVIEDSSMPEAPDASGFAELSELNLKLTEPQNCLSNANSQGDNAHCSLALNNSTPASQVPCGSPKGGTPPRTLHLKVDRRHWDLNTVMDAWDEPYDDTIAEHSSKAISETHTESKQEASEVGMLYSAGGTRVESSRQTSEENKLVSVSTGRTCIELESTCLDYHLHKEASRVHSNIGIEKSDQAIEKDGPCNVGDRTTASDRVQARDQDFTLGDKPDAEVSHSAINVENNDVEDPQEISELPGTLNQDVQFVPIANSKVGSDETCVPNSTPADCKGQLGLAKLVIKCENSNLPNEETCSTGAQFDEPTTSVGKVGSTIDNHRGSDVSSGNDGHLVDGDDLNMFRDGYDSPYEDGELRGLCLYPSEENDLENECVDYESDGRMGDGCDADDYPGSEIVEGGSEVSYSASRSLLARGFPHGNGSKNRLVNNSLRKHFMKDDSDNVIGGKKDSNSGYGTTVEQSMEMVAEDNDDGVRRHFTDRRGISRGKVVHVGEYSSRMSRGRLHSRAEGRSSFDATNGKDAFFMQQCRTRRFGGSYSRPERDFSPDQYLGRYKAASHMSERDDVNQWAYWGSRSRYASGYQGVDGRNHGRPRSDSGADFQDLANNESKSFHRPFVRRRSPVDRDDCFTVRRRVPLTRGFSSYRSRGRYPRNAIREFGNDFEPVGDDTSTSVRLSRYFERSFSPSPGRGAHFPITRRRSRSRSRTRSPKPWHSQRERNFNSRRPSRSPGFRPEARARAPFSKPNLALDYGEGYMSPPPRTRFSPQRRNCRWGDDRNFGDNNNNPRRQRSPDNRVFRRAPRFDGMGSSGRLKSDKYFRPMMRPARFAFTSDDGSESRECKIETDL